MSDLLDDKGQLLISPGDIVDKLVILMIKNEKIDDAEQKLRIFDEYGRTQLLWDRLQNLYEGTGLTQLINLMNVLYTINKDQWNLEDRVRTEESWEAARAARENNNKRVGIKNQINELFGYPTEIKRYKK